METQSYPPLPRLQRVTVVYVITVLFLWLQQPLLWQDGTEIDLLEARRIHLVFYVCWNSVVQVVRLEHDTFERPVVNIAVHDVLLLDSRNR